LNDGRAIESVYPIRKFDVIDNTYQHINSYL